MSFYQQLQQATASERAQLQAAPIIADVFAGQISISQYIAFLTEAYHHVKHTLPLLMACGSRLPERLEWLRTAVAEYIEEECGHQEWILNDIKACGGDAEAVRHGQPALATELMVAYAYDTISRGNPAGFFGMVQVLEGTSIALATQAAARIAETLQLPPKAFSYLNSHGSLDIKHVQFFEGLMERISEPADQAAIIHAAKLFYRLYGDIFRSLPRSEAHHD